MINTDSDAVHTGGYSYFSKLGATIIAQEDANISNDISTIKFKDSMTINFNDQIFEIYHHVVNSFDDAIVYMPKSNLLVMGNIYEMNWFPVFFTGGILGFNEALDNALSLADEFTKILPSTGKLTNTQALRQHKQNVREMIFRIHQLRLLESKAESIVKDEILNEVWLKMADESVMNDKIKLRMVQRYISTDFITSFPLTTDELNSFIGTYEYEDKTVATMVLKNNKLVINEGSLAELIPQSNSSFHVRGSVGDSIEFEFNEKNEVISFSYFVQGEEHKAVKK